MYHSKHVQSNVRTEQKVNQVVIRGLKVTVGTNSFIHKKQSQLRVINGL